jgi:hypothetical protein
MSSTNQNHHLNNSQRAGAALSRLWSDKNLPILLFAYILISLIATIQGISHGPKVYAPGTRPYTDYNNYVIFKYSFTHLLHNQDIYQYFPEDHWDLYKYSPGFSVFFGLFSWLPDPVGLFIWNLINTLSLFLGIKMLRGLDNKRKSWILLLSLPELLLSIQNSQSNGLMAGLIILAFALAERSKYFLSAFCIVFSVYIKLFGILAFVFYLFYPPKTRLAAYSIFWMVFMAALPLVVVSPHQLSFIYSSWLHLLQGDHTASIGLSVMGLMESWFQLTFSKNMVALAGLLLFSLPLIRIRQYKDYYFRLLYLASALIWIVIFNHKAESPTFIIAISGIGIWYFSQVPSTVNTILVILSFCLITLSVSDLVPTHVKHEIVQHYSIKAVMPIVIWCKILYEQLTLRYQPRRLPV